MIEIRTPTDSPPDSPSITPLLSTSNTSNSFDEDILIDDSDSRGTGLGGIDLTAHVLIQ